MSTAHQILLALIPVAYLIGSIPFGLIVGLARGVDVRQAGSGNIGATNVGRLLGGKFFALVFLLDVLKGAVPVLAAGAVLHFRAGDWLSYLLWLAVGFAAILGHMFSLFLKLKGGKGVATSTGVILGVWPYYTLPGLLAAGVWVGVFKATRYVSLASMLGAVVFPIAYVLVAVVGGWLDLRAQWPLLGFAVLVAVLIVYKHRGNIARLRAGTELRIARRGRVGANGDGAGSEDAGNGEGETRASNR